MDKRFSVTARFSAGTQRHLWADTFDHGHSYEVKVTSVSLDHTLPAALAGIAAELHLKNLAKMMPGASTDLDGIAAWILERLILDHQGIVEIEVREDDLSIILERPLRAAVRG